MLDNRKILAENLTKLLATRSESRLALSRKMGVADGSLGRIKYGTGNPTLEALEGIARFFRLEVWHLFVPGLDPANPPDLPGRSGSQEWPFRRIAPDGWRLLGPTGQASAEGYIEGLLAVAADKSSDDDTPPASRQA